MTLNRSYCKKKSLTIRDTSSEIIKARNRLFEFGDYKNTDLSSEIFDEKLALAISDLQLFKDCLSTFIILVEPFILLFSPIQQLVYFPSKIITYI